MYILLFILWLLLNGRVTLEVVLLGLFLMLLLSLLVNRVLEYSWKKDLRLLTKFPLLVVYFFVLLWAILKANVSVISFILGPQSKIRPTLITFAPEIRTRLGRYLLANSITLTPGTITVDVTDGVFTVHCLKASLLDTSDRNIFVRLIRRLEA